MNRSPLFYPMNRGMDPDAGGAAELQTDVMRFMAIISMCLVAIFALVQSIPLAPQSPDPVVEDVSESLASPEPVVEPAQAPETPAQNLTLTRPEPVALRDDEAPVALRRPAPTASNTVAVPEPVKQTSVTEPAPPRQPAAIPPARRGFTLRFESDAVLTRLVANETVGLYVIAGKQTRKLQIASGRISYWSSSTPEQVHEMDPATVPESFVTTWNRQHGSEGVAEKWGVSLPPSMSRQVRNHIADSDGGSLIIGDNGQVRLER